MKDKNKTRDQLINEFVEMRQQITELETLESERKQAEEALRESREQFRQMAENINEVFFFNNAELTEIIYVSPAYEDIHTGSDM